MRRSRWRVPRVNRRGSITDNLFGSRGSITDNIFGSMGYFPNGVALVMPGPTNEHDRPGVYFLLVEKAFGGRSTDERVLLCGPLDDHQSVNPVLTRTDGSGVFQAWP